MARSADRGTSTTSFVLCMREIVLQVPLRVNLLGLLPGLLCVTVTAQDLWRKLYIRQGWPYWEGVKRVYT